MRRSWERYQRQLGLVYQARVVALRVLLVGDDPAMYYALADLALLGMGATGDGCLLILVPHAERPVTPDDLVHQALLRHDDVGSPLDQAVINRLAEINPDVRCRFVTHDTIGQEPDVVLALGNLTQWNGPGRSVIYGRTGRVALAFGASPSMYLRAVGARHRGLLTAPLASALGALMVQEALRVCKLLRPFPIERFWLTATLRVPPGVALSAPPSLVMGGATFYCMPAERELAGDERGSLYRAVLPFDHDLTQLLWGATVVDAEVPPGYSEPHAQVFYSPFTAWRPAQTAAEADAFPDGINTPRLPESISGRHIVLGGAGGLGSWVLATLAAVPLHDCTVYVIDSDTNVERHNLNRQVLYRENHLGLPKRAALADAARTLRSGLSIEADDRRISVDDRRWLRDLVHGCGAVLTTFDNYSARYALAMAACLANVPVINGGSLIFRGDVEVLRAQREGCIECLWEAEEGPQTAAHHRSDAETFSCTREDESVGQIGTAIVTTNALVGSLQSLLLLTVLAEPDAPASGIDHKVQVWGQENLISRCKLPGLLHREDCPTHSRRAAHDQHVARYIGSSMMAALDAAQRGQNSP